MLKVFVMLFAKNVVLPIHSKYFQIATNKIKTTKKKLKID